MDENKTFISVYKIPETLETVEQVIENSLNPVTGEYEISPDAIVSLDVIKNDVEKGLDYLARKHVNLNHQDEACDSRIKEIEESISQLIEPFQAEINRLKMKRKTILNRMEFDKYIVLEIFKSLGVDNVVLPNGDKIWVQKTVSTNISSNADISTWEDKFRRVKYEADKTALKEAYKNGEFVPAGVEFFINKTVRFPK